MTNSTTPQPVRAARTTAVVNAYNHHQFARLSWEASSPSLYLGRRTGVEASDFIIAQRPAGRPISPRSTHKQTEGRKTPEGLWALWARRTGCVSLHASPEAAQRKAEESSTLWCVGLRT